MRSLKPDSIIQFTRLCTWF